MVLLSMVPHMVSSNCSSIFFIIFLTRIRLHQQISCHQKSLPLPMDGTEFVCIDFHRPLPFRLGEETGDLIYVRRPIQVYKHYVGGYFDFHLIFT